MSSTTSPPTQASPVGDFAQPIVSQPGEPVWEIARFFPPQGQWSDEEYLALETNHLLEFTDGTLEFLPMPEALHQYLSQLLFEILKGHVTASNLGKVLYAPYRVQVRNGSYREPDLIYVPQGGRTPRKMTVDAALIMEIVSEGTEHRERDTIQKRAEYAAAGIPEYWIVDPQQRSITVLTLPEGASEYSVHGEFTGDVDATSVLLDGFAVPVAATFNEAESMVDEEV